MQNHAQEHETAPSSIATSPTSPRILNIYSTNAGDLKISLASAPDAYIFYLKNTTLSPGKPSLTLHSISETGPTLAAVKLNPFKPHIVGVGNPDENANIQWEDLRKGGGWRTPTQEFEYGSGGERKTYRWAQNKKLGFGSKGQWILKEINGDGEGLAIWKWSKGFKVSPWGTFEVKTNGHGLEEWNDWELFVIITGLAIAVSNGSNLNW